MDQLRSRGLGTLLLCIWLIFAGVASLFRLTFSGEDVILALLMVGAGLFLLLGR